MDKNKDNVKQKKIVLAIPHQKDVTLYKNQPLVIIHKPEYDGNYLQVGIDEWLYAKTMLKDAAFTLYLYFASNKNNYRKSGSPQDFCNKTGMCRKSYYNARNELEEKGFINISKAKGTREYDVIDFYTNPSLNPNIEIKYDES